MTHEHHRRVDPPEDSIVQDGVRVVRGICRVSSCPERLVYLPVGGDGFHWGDTIVLPRATLVLPYRNQVLAEERLR